MDWLPVLQNLKKSRVVVVAVFVSTIVAHFGPKHAPSVIDPVGGSLAQYVVPTMIFTGILLVVWSLIGAWQMCGAVWVRGSQFVRSQLLNAGERSLLLFMAETPSSVTNLGRVRMEESTTLELLQISKSLERKGLVMNVFDEELLLLTEKGKRRALSLQRKRKHYAATKS